MNYRSPGESSNVSRMDERVLVSLSLFFVFALLLVYDHLTFRSRPRREDSPNVADCASIEE